MIVYSESEMFISMSKDKGTFLEQIKRLLRVKNESWNLLCKDAKLKEV